MRRWLWVVLLALLVASVLPTGLVAAESSSDGNAAGSSGPPIAVSVPIKGGGGVTTQSGPSPVPPLPD